MKAICISACEIPGVGIVQAGDEVKLHDGFYNDKRIRTHFHIVESSVKDKNAKPPDMMAEADARRERFAKSLADHTAQIVALNKLVDAGVELPRELAEPDGDDAPTEQERVAKIVELWCDNFGYAFPTDERKKPQGKEKPAKKPAKGEKEKPPEGGEEAQPDGEKGEGEAEDKPAGKDEGKGAEDAQQTLFDKLNGNELWCDNFGYAFPTDERKKPQGKEKPAKKPAKDKPAGKDEGKGAEDAQQTLFDKLNGNP